MFITASLFWIEYKYNYGDISICHDINICTCCLENLDYQWPWNGWCLYLSLWEHAIIDSRRTSPFFSGFDMAQNASCVFLFKFVTTKGSWKLPHLTTSTSQEAYFSATSSWLEKTCTSHSRGLCHEPKFPSSHQPCSRLSCYILPFSKNNRMISSRRQKRILPLVFIQNSCTELRKFRNLKLTKFWKFWKIWHPLIIIAIK